MISVDWGGTQIISIPKSYLSLVSGTLYNLDTQVFRTDLLNLQDDLLGGMPYSDTHIHATEVTIVGVTYARFIEIIPPYSVEFEDGQYSVNLVGSNNNFFDVENGILVQNQVQVIASNSAGLITDTTGGSGGAGTQYKVGNLLIPLD